MMMNLIDAALEIKRVYPLVSASDVRNLVYANRVRWQLRKVRRGYGTQSGRAAYFVELDDALAYFAECYSALAAKRQQLLESRQSKAVSHGMPQTLTASDRHRSVLLGDEHNQRAAELERERRERERADAVRQAQAHPFLRERKGSR